MMKLKKKIKNFLGTLLGKVHMSEGVWWIYPFARKLASLRSGEIRKMPDFEERYFKLISGLDEESIALVNRTLARICFLSTSGCSFIRVSPDEKLRMLNAVAFHHEIFEVSSSCYAWRNYFLPINQFESSVFLFKHGIETLKNKDYFYNKDIIDVGGFVGDSAIVLQKYTNSKVYSFEPNTRNFELMYKTIALNHATKIVPVKLGLGAKDEQLKMSGALSMAQVKKDLEGEGEVISITTLDRYIEEHNLTVGLIKVDIEGAEQDFLKGALNTIKTQKPILLLSIYHSMDDYLSIKPYIESLNLGYSFRIYRPDDGGVMTETLLICELL